MPTENRTDQAPQGNTPAGSTNAGSTDQRSDASTEALRGQIAYLTAENARLTQELAQANDPKRLDSRVAARVALVGQASAVLGAEFKADGKDDLQIMREVLATAEPALKLDGAGADFVRGAYAMAIAKSTAATKALANVNSATDPARLDAASQGQDRILTAAAKSDERMLNRWKRDTRAGN